jgi:hypothetical protein
MAARSDAIRLAGFGHAFGMPGPGGRSVTRGLALLTPGSSMSLRNPVRNPGHPQFGPNRIALIRDTPTLPRGWFPRIVGVPDRGSRTARLRGPAVPNCHSWTSNPCPNRRLRDHCLPARLAQKGV